MKKKLALGAAAVTFFLALLITLYPLISTAYNRQHQSQIHLQHQEQVEQADDQALEAAWELAEAYNAALVPGVQNLERFTPEQLKAAAEGYNDLLDIAGDGILCYVTIPKLDVCLPVYHGTSDAVLELGLGHLLGTSLPIGGSSSHSVITGHSGLASQRLLVRGTRIPYEEASPDAETAPTEPVTSTWEQEYRNGILIGMGIVGLLAIIMVIIWRIWRCKFETL